MSGRDWFIVGARLIGIWVAYSALAYVTAYIDIKLGYTEETGRSGHPGGLLIHAFGYLLLALYLLLGTRHLAWLCYENDDSVNAKHPSSGLPAEDDLA